MKAAVYERHGPPDVVQVRDVETPTPAPDQVLIKVRAAALNPLDWRMMRGKPYLLRLALGAGEPRPRRLGHDVAGLVESVGRNVTRFGPGDPVFGTCAGSVAEYACASETSLAPRPDNLTFEQAASVPVAALTALQGLRDMGRIEAGQQVLVHGAAGGIGTFAVQIARSFGADVTGVCSTRNVEMVRSIGAARVVDYTREDVTRGDARFDLILECVGNLPVQACRRILTPRGTCVLAGASGGIGSILMRSIQAFAASRSGGPRFALFVAKSGAADLGVLGELLQAGRVMPVIDRCYRMSETGEALRYLEAGHARGKVVITVEPT